MERNDYDSPWKEALVRYLPQFFQFFFPDIYAGVDWIREPRFLDKELQAIAPRRSERERGGKRVVDSLVELYRIVGEPTWVLVHVEIQAQRVECFERRMLLYHTRILEKFAKPVCSLVILADESLSWRPSTFEHALWGTELKFRYPVAKLLDYRRRLPDIEASSNAFAIITAATLHAKTTKAGSPLRFAAKVRLCRNLLRAGSTAEDVRELFKFIDWILRLSPRQEELFRVELSRMEEETRMAYITSIERLGRRDGLKEGLEKGLEQGREQGHKEVAKRMLSLGFPREQVLQVTDLAEEALKLVEAEMDSGTP